MTQNLTWVTSKIGEFIYILIIEPDLDWYRHKSQWNEKDYLILYQIQL